MIAFLAWQALGLLTTLFAAFIASHFYRVVLRSLVAASVTAYVITAAALALVDEPRRHALLGPLAGCFSTSVPLAQAAWALGLAALAFVAAVAYFIPRYKAHGLGPQQGTLRSVLFPFRAVALTFDDGPDPLWTPRVLEVLKREQVKATFFMVGENIERYPDIAREVARQGHTVGVHGHAHRLLPMLTAAELSDDFDRAAQAFEAVLGRKPQHFRPPWGAYNRIVLDEARSRGYLTVLWTRSSEDWRNQGVERIVDLASSDLRLGEIILMHDAGNYPRPSDEELAKGGSSGQSREQTVQALKPLIDAAEGQGFQFKTLDEMVAAWLS